MILAGVDAHLGAFYGPLGSTFAVLGWFWGHFEESLVTFVRNVESCQMYGKPLFFVGFSWISRCLEGLGWSLWMVLATSLLVGRYLEAPGRQSSCPGEPQASPQSEIVVLAEEPSVPREKR